MKPQPSGTGYDVLSDLPGDARIPAKGTAAAPGRRKPVRIAEPIPWQLPHNIVVPDLPAGGKKPIR